MAEYVKIEAIGTVYKEPKYQTGTKKDGNPYTLGSFTLKADHQFFNCQTFDSGDAEFIGRLQDGDKVMVKGSLKNKKGQDEKYYTKLDIDFIQCRDDYNQPQQQEKQANQQERPQEEPSPYDFQPKQVVRGTSNGVSDDDLPF